MLRFPELESVGLSLAAVTEIDDGDFARPGGRPESVALAFAGLSPRPVATLRQVHGTRVETADRDNVESLKTGEGDALITNAPDIAVGVRVADCVPVILFDPTKRVLGVVHAGRVGTMSGVTAEAIRAMKERFSVVPSDVFAAIGPSAGPCCYEVDPATATEFTRRGYPTNGRLLDLWEANRLQLVDEGVQPTNVTIAGVCTICSGRFHSYRATATTSRNLAIAAL